MNGALATSASDLLGESRRSLLASGLREGPAGSLLFPGSRGRGLRASRPSCAWSRWSGVVRRPAAARRSAGVPVDLDARFAPDGPFRLWRGRNPRGGRAPLRIVADLPLLAAPWTPPDTLPAASGRLPARAGDSDRTFPLLERDLPPDFRPDLPSRAASPARAPLLEEWAGSLRAALEPGSAALQAPPAPAGAATPARSGAPDAHLGSRLRSDGWNVSPRADELRVNLSPRSGFWQVRLIATASGGLGLECELADTASWSAEARRLGFELARRAGEELRLVRFVARGPFEAAMLHAEVRLGPRLAASRWVELSLGALRAAVSLVGPELAALADAELASWLVDLSSRRGGLGGQSVFHSSNPKR